MISRIIVALSLVLSVQSVGAASVDPSRIIRPEGSSAPESSAPESSAPESSAPEIDRTELLEKGELLWNDPSLASNNKTTCASCHKDNTRMFKKTFLEPYPHQAKMPKKKAGVDSVTAEGMVQFCMIVPMKSEPLPWDSEDLAALVAYIEDVVQKDYIEKKSKK